MTMNNTTRQKIRRRQLLALLGWGSLGAGCSAPALKAVELGADEQRRFRGVGIVLVVDAVSDAQMESVMIYDDREQRIYTKSLVSRRTREVMALGGTRVPAAVRAVWRKNARYEYSRAIWFGGTVVGDYTIPVAERIPDEVLRDIRANGGALRLKFRLKPDGVLFGWDIERPGGGISHFDMPGGDFLETRH